MNQFLIVFVPRINQPIDSRHVCSDEPQQAKELQDERRSRNDRGEQQLQEGRKEATRQHSVMFLHVAECRLGFTSVFAGKYSASPDLRSALCVFSL